MKSKLMRCVLLAALGCGLPTAVFAGDLKFSMQDGRVTIVADNVPLRQILQEWARVGQSRIMNVDKLNGPAVTLQLIDVPEKEALDVLLRSASGYIAAPRPVVVAGASMYDRITIMAASHAPAAIATAAPPPTFQRPPQPMDESDEPINVVAPNQPRNPVVGPYPGMPQGMPPQGFQPQPGVPTAPATSPRPGMLPPPQMPAGVPNPYQPTIIRPGGPGGPGL